MRTFIQCLLLFSISVLFLSPSAAGAHDGWIEVAPAIVEKGQPVAVALMQGNHSNEHRSYRLAGKWDLEFTKVTVIAKQERVLQHGDSSKFLGVRFARSAFAALPVPIAAGGK